MASIIDPRYASSLNDLYPRPDGSRPFDLAGLDFVAVGLVVVDDLPVYEPSPEDQAWALGYETEQAGERAKLGTLGGFTAAEHLAFARGQAQARTDRVEEAPAVPVARPTPEELSSMLRLAAMHCEGQGGVLGEFLTNLIRDAAKDVEYYRAGTWDEYSAREAEMIQTLQDCPTCQRDAYADRM